MKVERIWTGNWENALHGMRHPYESYDKSDSVFISPDNWTIGPKDMELAQKLIAAGTPNDKFLRQIFVSIDVTLPLYVWNELDTYKVGTVANSTSKMHKLATTPITPERFEWGDMDKSLIVYDNEPYGINEDIEDFWKNYLIPTCEMLRVSSLRAKKEGNMEVSERYWKELIRLLPESWLQTRTFTCNYAVLRNIYHWRKNHRLKEWRDFCSIIEKELPYAKELIVYNN